ncbi:hypothetical protein BCR33DRAFT_712997 [Rhizoclosmatium globosum]|uniref:Lethal giant larvae (Lgl)-like C-terminal domain-containing protein n=1 Tax=Rhizoclosmatium globosum TaxID=329046 RepID=A0A1Y2CVS8_9FUNG|nr:hypothetical protein BCR33DRAFT_712997 [Rhizoclosmatium globosum]|eukprot:ORY51077.1 hypothetical protein BCR33DRAFT_712997 [Rhizoclosmatium globosum]
MPPATFDPIQQTAALVLRTNQILVSNATTSHIFHAPANHLVFSHGDPTLLSISPDTVTRINTSTLSTSPQISRRGAVLLGCEDGCVVSANVGATGMKAAAYTIAPVYKGNVSCLAVENGVVAIGYGGSGGGVVLWSLKERVVVAVIPTLTGVRKIAWDSDLLLVLCGDSGVVNVYSTGRLFKKDLKHAAKELFKTIKHSIKKDKVATDEVAHIRDFCIVSPSSNDSISILLAWTTTTTSHVTLLTVHPPAPKSQSTSAQITYSSSLPPLPDPNIDAVAPFSPHLYVASSITASLTPFIITESNTLVLADEANTPPVLLFHVLPRCTESLNVDGSIVTVTTLHPQDSTLRIWSLGNSTITSLDATISTKHLLHLDSTAHIESHSEHIGVACGAVIVLFGIEEEEGSFELGEDEAGEEEEVAVEEEPQVVKQISTLQLHDLEADTPQETIPPPLPPRQDPPLKEEQERFVKNDSCMVSFPPFPETPTQQNGWTPLLQIMASGVVETFTYSPHTHLLAFSTTYGDLTLLNTKSGHVIFTEPVKEDRPSGGLSLFATTPRPRKVVVQVGNGMYPCYVGLLNQDGDVVEGRTRKMDSEHYLVFVHGSVCGVYMLSPTRAPRVLVKRNAGAWFGKLFGKPSTESLKGGGEVRVRGAGVVRNLSGEPCLVVVPDTGCVKVLRLPGLDVLESPVGSVGGIEAVQVLTDGNIYCSGSVGRGWDLGGRVCGKVVGGVGVYDFGKERRWWKEVGGDKRDKELEALFVGSPSKDAREELLEGSTVSPSSGSSSAVDPKTANMLSNLEQKFGDLSKGSGDLLKTIKEYNERQEKKKWYEL